MAWTLVRTNKAQTTAGSSLGAPAMTVAAGDLVFLVVDSDQSGNSFTVSDSLGNTWMQAATHDNGVSMVATVFYSVITAGGTTTLTATLTGPGGFITLIAGEWHDGSGGTITADGVAQAHGVSTTPSSGPITTTGASELLISVLNFGGVTTFTPGAGWTTEELAATAGTIPAVLADQVNKPVGTYTGDWTAGGSASWIATIAAFKATGGLTTATLSGPAAGTVGVPSASFTITLDHPAGTGGVSCGVTSSQGGDTITP